MARALDKTVEKFVREEEISTKAPCLIETQSVIIIIITEVCVISTFLHLLRQAVVEIYLQCNTIKTVH